MVSRIMMKKCLLIVGFVFLLGSGSLFANPDQDDFGQTIQINTQFHSFLGHPSWLLVIRDLDHGQNIPYLYDFDRGTNFWLAFTYGGNYLITASTLTFNPYHQTVNNFCGLESRGRIMRGVSLYITMTGDLTPHSTTFRCRVLKMNERSLNDT